MFKSRLNFVLCLPSGVGKGGVGYFSCPLVPSLASGPRIRSYRSGALLFGKLDSIGSTQPSGHASILTGTSFPHHPLGVYTATDTSCVFVLPGLRTQGSLTGDILVWILQGI